MGVSQDLVISTDETCRLTHKDLSEFMVALHRHGVKSTDTIECVINHDTQQDTVYFRLRATIVGERL